MFLLTGTACCCITFVLLSMACLSWAEFWCNVALGFVQDLVDMDHLASSLAPQLVTMVRAYPAQGQVLVLVVLAVVTVAARPAATPKVLSMMPLVELLMTGA